MQSKTAGLISSLVLAIPAYAEDIKPQFQVKSTTVVVQYAEDYAELRDLALAHDVTIQPGYRLDGFSVTVYDPSTNKSKCIIVALEPLTVDDERTRTLGHELLHCLTGAYHD